MLKFSKAKQFIALLNLNKYYITDFYCLKYNYNKLNIEK